MAGLAYNPRKRYLTGLRGLGQPYSGDAQALASYGYSPDQITQVFAAHQSGALSDAGYNAIISGYVPPEQLAGFLDQDPGASAGGSGTQALTATGTSLTAALNAAFGVQPRPGIATAIPGQVIAGIPNTYLLIGGMLMVALLAGAGKRR